MDWLRVLGVDDPAFRAGPEGSPEPRGSSHPTTSTAQQDAARWPWARAAGGPPGAVRAGPLAAVWAEAQRLSRLGGEQGRQGTQSPQAAPWCHAGSQTGISCRWPVTARCWPAGASVPPGRAVGQAAWATGPLHGPWCVFFFFIMRVSNAAPLPADPSGPAELPTHRRRGDRRPAGLGGASKNTPSGEPWDRDTLPPQGPRRPGPPGG